MLTRVENFTIAFVPHTFSKRGHVRFSIGNKWWVWKNWRLTNNEFDSFLDEVQITPYRFDLDEKTYWLYEDRLYKDNEGLNANEVKALLITRKKQQRSRIERAIAISSGVCSNSHKELPNTHRQIR